MPPDHAALIARIKKWRETDDDGYDVAIELLCEAEEALEQAEAQLRFIAEEGTAEINAAVELRERLAEARRERDEARAENARLREALELMLASARPHPVLHPTMTAAWAQAREALAAPPETGQWREEGSVTK